jgi:hypothetical protein
MKKVWYTWLLILCTSGLAVGQTLPKAGQNYQSVTVDLNGDGRAEKVSLTAYKVDADVGSFFGRLRVSDGKGKVIWEAPKATDADDTFAFGEWPYGVTNLEWIGDIDGDSKVELLARAPVSDVRPPTFKRFRWNGKAFEPMASKILLEDKPGSGRFLWRDPFEWDGVQPLTWISSLSGAPGKKTAEVVSYRQEGAMWGGTAEMSGNGLGLTVKSWTTKLGPLE